jgi:transcription antitermination factor NusG
MMIDDRSLTPGDYAQDRAAGRFAAGLALAPGERWYVATTLSGKERVASVNLANQKYRSLVPLQLTTRRHGRKLWTGFAPVFPRYIFVILDVERQRWRSVNGTLGVQRLIMENGRPLAVAPGIVETLVQSTDERGALIFKCDGLAVGDRVRLLAGPFAGSFGVLQRLDGAARVQLLLELLGGEVKVAVARENVAAAR